MAEMYDPASIAVERMAEAFAHEEPGELTSAQMQTIAFALRATQRPGWIDGFAAAAHLMNRQYERYERLRDEYLGVT